MSLDLRAMLRRALGVQRIRIEAGSEYSPTGVGRVALTLDRDGLVELRRRRVGMPVAAWSARVTPRAIVALEEALERAGFPAVADTGGALVPDEAPTTFTLERGLWRATSASVAYRQLNAGYREAIALFDALSHFTSRGALGHVAEPVRWLVGDDPDTHALAGAPRVGDDIYLPSERYLSRGEDDFAGGLCRVVRVRVGASAGVPCAFVEVAEQPGVQHNWEHLAPQQDALRRAFGARRGRPDPDDRAGFNESITDQLIAEGSYEQVPVTFRATGDAAIPLAAEWGGKRWELRVDVSAKGPRYTLLVDGGAVGSYAVLPKAWRTEGPRR